MSMHMFTHGIYRSRLLSDVNDGVAAMIALYYEENTDADSLDAGFRNALERVLQPLPCEFDLEALEAVVRADITDETGRLFSEED